jgi:hypothetical protein
MTKTVTVEIHIPEDIASQGRTKVMLYLIDKHKISFLDRVFIDGQWSRIASESSVKQEEKLLL